ncbi:MAG: molecular chaperone HtpG [Bdellovibrionales bacterium]
MTSETLSFGTDVGRLLDIVANALYSNKDVFLRELISNSSDACDRLRYELIANKKLKGNKEETHIRIFVDTDARTVSVIDNGIGMNRQELIDHLGTIAKSGTSAIMEELSKSKSNDKDAMNLIGQFGVGFYASFMVAHKVDVISRKIGEKDFNVWSSDGKTGFTLEDATDEQKQLIDQSGTAIILHIKDEACEYLIEPKLKEIIETWADHVDVPIYLGKIDEDSDDIEAPVNAANALWARPKSEIKDEDYNGFFQHLSNGLVVDEPLMTTHWRAEGTIEYTGLLFTPSMRPWDLFDPSRKHAVKLYVKRVFITDECGDLMYPWLRFLRGVIDSQDLPLNISREMLQHNPVINKIKNGVATKVLKELDTLSKNEKEKFLTFWQQFGAVLKEGLYDAAEHQAGILNVCRFYSTTSDIEAVSLEDYTSRMKDGQEDIYYISGENVETLKNSPQLEGFKSRGIEVLLFKDTIDDFWLQSVPDFNGKKFVSVTKGSIDLDKVGKADNTDEKKSETPKTTKKVEDLITLIKETLAEEVSDVKVSTRLTTSPSCLIAAENEVDLKMERILKTQQQYDANAKRVLEINGNHSLIKKLAKNPANDHVKDAAHLLLDQAKIALGEPVDNPTEFARRLNYFIESGSE